jgi:hypothetical protein
VKKLKELKKIPIPDDGKNIIVAVIIGAVSLVLGWLIHDAVSQVILAAAVFIFASGVLEWEKQRIPGKYPEGFFGFGAAYDDIGLGLGALIVFLIAAYLGLHLIAAIITIALVYLFMEMEEDRRTNEHRSQRRSDYY